MAESYTHVNVLFAHPSDALKYLPTIRRVFNDANETSGRLKSVQFDVYNWEDNAYRCSGEAQKLINEQLVEKADIVLAVFESKLGTHGNGYESGTDEEIHIAKDNGNNDIWIYFSESGYDAAKAGEKERLDNYKASMEKKYFYTDFRGEEALGRSLRNQITEYLKNKDDGNNKGKHAGIKAVAEILKGEKRNIELGKYKWRVLDKQADKALLLAEYIIEKRPYDILGFEDATWESCTLREYLNNEFFSEFSRLEQAGILKTRNANPDNQWYKTNGGNRTTDKVFLLSIDELVKYFGDSGDLASRKGWYWSNNKFELKDGKGYCINDRYNYERVAKYGNDWAWWWLRSPGLDSSDAAYVDHDGVLYLDGSRVYYENGGVRPALWLNLES
ncbi:MAG: DUF6273 domain-containing protein [Clostridiales Family XIII bacterium]|nr:DUF6273 domain-containing protein [Clostridiales Family XIII bacterium]